MTPIPFLLLRGQGDDSDNHACVTKCLEDGIQVLWSRLSTSILETFMLPHCKANLPTFSLLLFGTTRKTLNWHHEELNPTVSQRKETEQTRVLCRISVWPVSVCTRIPAPSQTIFTVWSLWLAWCKGVFGWFVELCAHPTTRLSAFALKWDFFFSVEKNTLFLCNYNYVS